MLRSLWNSQGEFRGSRLVFTALSIVSVIYSRDQLPLHLSILTTCVTSHHIQTDEHSQWKWYYLGFTCDGKVYVEKNLITCLIETHLAAFFCCSPAVYSYIISMMWFCHLTVQFRNWCQLSVSSVFVRAANVLVSEKWSHWRKLLWLPDPWPAQYFLGYNYLFE